MTQPLDGRMHARRVPGVAVALDGGRVAITAPAVGRWHPRVAHGATVRAGDVIGALEILGAQVDVIAPGGAHGAVAETAPADRAVTPVGFGTVLLVVDPHAGPAAADDAAGPAARAAATGLVFTAPISGRFFARSGPGKPPFVAVGAELAAGQTICMLEVMKTFHRVTYGGGGLPERARVVTILVEDEADVTMGQAILALEAMP